MNTSINGVTAPEWAREEPEMGSQCQRFEKHKVIDVKKKMADVQRMVSEIIEKNSL